jgi:hypothetical protein
MTLLLGFVPLLLFGLAAHRSAWMREPIVLTRRVILALALAVGVVGAGAILGYSASRADIKRERDRAIRDSEVRSSDTAARLIALEAPSVAELRRRILEGFRGLTREEVRRVLAQLARGTSARERRAVLRILVKSAPHVAQPVAPDRRQPELPVATTGPKRRPPGPKPAPVPVGPNPGSTPPVQPPRPPVDLTLPPVGPVAVPSVCLPVVALNCP